MPMMVSLITAYPEILLIKAPELFAFQGLIFFIKRILLTGSRETKLRTSFIDNNSHGDIIYKRWFKC